MPLENAGIGFTMTQIKMDKLQFGSMVDTFTNYQTITKEVALSGTIADGASSDFTVVIPHSRFRVRADVYVKNLTSGIKRSLNTGTRETPYTYVSTEVITQSAVYSNNQITVTFTITNNTGSSISVTPQTLQVTSVLFSVPING